MSKQHNKVKNYEENISNKYTPTNKSYEKKQCYFCKCNIFGKDMTLIDNLLVCTFCDHDINVCIFEGYSNSFFLSLNNRKIIHNKTGKYFYIDKLKD